MPHIALIILLSFLGFCLYVMLGTLFDVVLHGNTSSKEDAFVTVVFWPVWLSIMIISGLGHGLYRYFRLFLMKLFYNKE